MLRLLERDQSFNFLVGFRLFLRWGLAMWPSLPRVVDTGVHHHAWPWPDLRAHLR